MSSGPVKSRREAEHRPLAVTRLRPRLVATFALVASVTAVAVAVTSYSLVRRAVLDRAQADAVAQTGATLAEAAETLGAGPSSDELSAFVGRLRSRASGGFEAVTVTVGGEAGSTSISLSEASVPPGIRAPVEAGRVVSARTAIAGRPYVVVGGRVPDTATFYAFFPLDGVDADLRTLRNVLAAVSAGLVVLSAAVGAVAARGLLTPLRRARRAVQRLEGGLLETRLPERGRDEFADLAQSFNRMAAALERTVGDLRALESSQRRFVADVSHELRTPLTALTTASDVLEQHAGGLDDIGRRAARVLVVESRRLATLVEDLMEISRLDAGAAAVARERVDLADLVGGALASRRWTGSVELRLAPGVVVDADPRRLDAIVGNLVGNALEHGRPPVRVSLTGDAETVRLEVADGGLGIPPDQLPLVFDRFYKAEASRPRSAGSGLGLAIARENARLHGGDISAAGPPGGGAVFTLVLPRHIVANLLPDGDVTETSGGDDGPDEERRLRRWIRR